MSVLPPHASQYPSAWSDSISAVWSQPSVMQIAGHTLSIAATAKQIIEAIKALDLAELHELLRLIRKNNVGHGVLLATSTRRLSDAGWRGGAGGVSW